MTWFPDHVWEELRTRQPPDDELLDDIVFKHSPGLRKFYEGQKQQQQQDESKDPQRVEENHHGE